MGLSWKETPAPSFVDSSDSSEFSLFSSIASRRKARVLRSGSGLTAIVLERKAVEAEPTLNIRFDAGTFEYTYVGLVTGFTKVDATEQDELGSLLKHCELVAIPADSAAEIGERFEQCGQLDFLPESAPATTFCLFRAKPVKASVITENAPTGQGEQRGDLEGREKWFEKRHQNGK